MGTVEAGTVPDHDRVFVLRDGRRKLFEELIDHRRVQLRAEQTFGVPGLGTHRTDHPQVFVLGLPDRCRPRTSASPDIGDRPLLTNRDSSWK